MSADVLAFTIELPDGKYASVNRLTRGWTDPRKSDIYKAIYETVYDAATAEIARVGWSKAECECFATILRVMPARWIADAMNMGKPELDALTEAGVWVNDTLANPCLPWIRHDDEGPHRVSIVVMKLYEPAHVRIVEKPKREVSKMRNSATGAPPPATSAQSKEPVRMKYDGQKIPEGMAVVNGYLEPAADIIAMLKKHAS